MAYNQIKIVCLMYPIILWYITCRTRRFLYANILNTLFIDFCCVNDGPYYCPCNRKRVNHTMGTKIVYLLHQRNRDYFREKDRNNIMKSSVD